MATYTSRDCMAIAQRLLADIQPDTIADLIALAQVHVFLGLLADTVEYRLG